ncbi:MAG: hypothetical protein V4557_10925 [Bacteroidota bacterium]
MSHIFVYPGNDAAGIPLVFSQLVNDASKTKLLVLGTDGVAAKAQEFIIHRITNDPDSYVSVLFLFVNQPALILADLKSLPVKLRHPSHSLDWDAYASYRIFSISPGNRMISDVITSTELEDAYAAIDSAILFAFSNG